MKWADGFENLTADQYVFIRKLRNEEPNHSWRAVAEVCAEEWGGDWDSNQLAGMDLCRAAAKFFNEDWD